MAVYLCFLRSDFQSLSITRKFHDLTPLLSPTFFILSNLQECPAYKLLSSFSTSAAFPRAVKPDFVRTDIFFGSFCAERKNGDGEHREAKDGGKKGRKNGRATGGTVKRAIASSMTYADHSWSNYLFFR